MTLNSLKIRKIFLLLSFTTGLSIFMYGSDIVQLSPLTKNVILIVFDDGTVNYPNDLQVDRLDLAAASVLTNYTIHSSDDSDFSNGVKPVDIGRKSKGTEFVKDAPWGGTSYDPRSKPWASKHFIYLILEENFKRGKTYTVNISGLAKNGIEWTFTFEEKNFRSEAVHVNTIGYETNAPKYGYVYQWMGDRGGLNLTAFSGKAFHIYKEGVTDPVYSGTLKKRKSASNAETGQAGDTPNRNFLGAEVYECNFSAVKEDGKYTLVVEDIGSSYPFKIGKDALWDAYYTVGRSLYYQRSGIRLAPPYTDGNYIRPVNQNTKVTSDDGTDFNGKLLYSKYPFIAWDDPDGGGDSQSNIRNSAIGNPLDVAGWYHDAGDWDSYYSHQRIPVLLMLTYEYFPERFADGDLNLPESGNGIPDIVDEASWLIKFNYRLRKELMVKGYSNGGVGGARVCPDVFNSVDGNAQNDKPSWQDYRRYVVTEADAFMTYLYAGQAAQFAIILKKLGKDPHSFPVEMLDAVDFDAMTMDLVDWEREASEAYAWATAEENQPDSIKNYAADLTVYQMYAATNLYRLTNEEAYHSTAKEQLEKVKNSSSLAEDERYAVYSYLLADNYSVNSILSQELKNSVINTAMDKGVAAAGVRACRWGGTFNMPMLVGQATTPWVFETMIAYGVTGRQDFLNVCHTTADYFLGTNPLHSSWATGLGPRPAEVGFHLDSRYNNNWLNYPGFIPYGPWSMSYGYDPYTWTIDGVVYDGGAGPWNKDWANFSQYPQMKDWPGHERWNSNIHAPLSSENTIHQNSVYGALTYGFVNNRQNRNSGSPKSITKISLNKTDITISEQGRTDTLSPTIDISDATFAALKWESSDPRVAHVDQMGRVSGVSSGSCVITCFTLDGSVSVSCQVSCQWAEIDVESISIEPDSLSLVEGQTFLLSVFFSPADASNKFVDWSYNEDGVVDLDEDGRITALSPGKVLVIATSLNGSKKDTLWVEVSEAINYIISDFDTVIPVLSEPKPDSSQLYTPGGSSDIEYQNPSIGIANPSENVVKYNRPAGTWKLIGIILPTEGIQSTDKYAQFTFKYYGSDIKQFNIQLTGFNNEQYEYVVSIHGADAWQLYAVDFNNTYDLKQFNVFVNAQDNAEMNCLFDDFVLAADKAVWYEGITISDNVLEMNSSDEYVLAAESDGNPYTWISENKEVATVNQEGKIYAISKGTTHILAQPLYGEAAECIVNVDGGEDIAVTGLTIDGASTLSFEVGGSQQLTASIVPANASKPDVIWTSDAPAIAEITSLGYLTAHAEGSAEITATSVSNTDISDNIIVSVESASKILMEKSPELMIYPNPAGREFVIFSNNTFKRMELFTISGKEVFSLAIPNKHEVEVQDARLGMGIYILKIQNSDNRIVVGKLVIE